MAVKETTGRKGLEKDARGKAREAKEDRGLS